MKFGKSIVLLLLVLFTLNVMPQASAEETAQSKGQWILLPVMKLSRGIAGITYGSLKGVCFILARIGVGVVDIVTFPVPLPNCPEDPSGYGPGYGPILTPAWVVDVDHDWQNFVYKEEAIVTDRN